MQSLHFKPLIFAILGLTLLFGSTPAMAQDKGKPVMEAISFYTLGGAGVGIGLGAAIFLLDPLNPDANLADYAKQGLAVGAIAGTIFGITQLQKQAITPKSNNNNDSGPSEFYESRLRIDPMDREERRLANLGREPMLPLVGMVIRF